MNIPLKYPVTVAASFFLIVIAAQAQDFNWDSGGGSDTKYEQAQNWDTNRVPASAGDHTMFLSVADGGTVTFDDASGNSQIDLLELSNGSVLNMSGGVFDHTKTGNVVRTSVGLAGDGSTLNQTGGKMTIGHMLRIGQKRASGTYNLSGGSLDIFRGGRSLMDTPATPSLSVGPGNAVAEMNISGGLFTSRFGVEIDSSATFRVLGSNATKIGIGLHQRSGVGSWFQKGTLSMGIGPNGVTKIEIIGNNTKEQFVTFLSGSELDLSFHNTVPYPGTWTLLEVEADIADEGLLLSKATRSDPNWSFEIDNTGPIGRLNAKYVDVPEPMSYALGLGGFCLLVVVWIRR